MPSRRRSAATWATLAGVSLLEDAGFLLPGEIATLPPVVLETEQLPSLGSLVSSAPSTTFNSGGSLSHAFLAQRARKAWLSRTLGQRQRDLRAGAELLRKIGELAAARRTDGEPRLCSVTVCSATISCDYSQAASSRWR